MFHEPAALLFASDATLVALAGIGLLLVAALAVWGDRRRAKRKHVDKVGWVPWTKIYVLCAFGGLVLLGMAIKGWASPS